MRMSLKIWTWERKCMSTCIQVCVYGCVRHSDKPLEVGLVLLPHGGVRSRCCDSSSLWRRPDVVKSINGNVNLGISKSKSRMTDGHHREMAMSRKQRKREQYKTL